MDRALGFDPSGREFESLRARIHSFFSFKLFMETNNIENQEKVFCGKEKVTENEKQNFVNSVFSSVCNKYDLMNNIMSFGTHHLWKNRFIKIMRQKILFKKNPIILDIASGSGDIMFKFLNKYYDLKSNNNFEPKCILSDINEDMLEKAKEKAIDNNLFNICEFKIEDMCNLSIKNESIDLCALSFGIRNCSNINKALEEIYRVLKRYSYFICIEFSKNASNPMIQKIYDLYSENLIPYIGEKITKDRQAYQYLVDSIKTFPSKYEFKFMMESNNFKNIDIIDLNFGLVNIYIGQKI